MDTTPAMACGDYVRGPWWQQVCLWVCWGWCSVSGCEKHNDSAAGIVLSWTVLQPSKMPGQAEIKTWESEPERGRLREESPPPTGLPRHSPPAPYGPPWGGGAPKGEEALL